MIYWTLELLNIGAKQGCDFHDIKNGEISSIDIQ